VAARRADATPSRPRPRPGPAPAVATGDKQPVDNSDAAESTANRGASKRAPVGRSSRRRPGRGLALPEPVQNGQLVAAAGSAIVTAARVGRLLGRSGWRIAKQVPGVNVLEQQAQRLGQAAATEMYRLLETPQQLFGAATAEEQRAMTLVQDAGSDPAPLRTAMTELLHRSSESSGGNSREYLFGTIVSQLVPDEARLLAALAGGNTFAAVDVVAKVGRSSGRTVLTNASTVGAAAGISVPANTATYLNRLLSFGLVEFGVAGDGLADQFELLDDDAGVRGARAHIEAAKLGSAKVVRKTVTLSPLGRDFWAACAPSRPGLSNGRP
jgi:hypothetical protein